MNINIFSIIINWNNYFLINFFCKKYTVICYYFVICRIVVFMLQTTQY